MYVLIIFVRVKKKISNSFLQILFLEKESIEIMKHFDFQILADLYFLVGPTTLFL